MTRPRPTSFGMAHSRPGTMPPYGRLADEYQFEQLLLRKIGILAEYHVRNVGALRRLERVSSAPKTAWAVPTHSPSACQAASFVKGTTRGPLKKGDSKRGYTQPINQTFASPSRTFTRVIATSSSPKYERVPTVVEPFRSMETHTAAWKRKNMKYEELEFQMKRDEEEAKIRDRERFVSAINGGRAFSGVIARSNEMVERRRKQQLEAKQREEENRQGHEFKARPLHIADEDWQTIQGRQTVRREQRVQLRKEMMSSISHLPRRMAMHAQKQKETVAVATDGRLNESEIRKKVRSVPPEKIRQILSRRQQRWDSQLQANKRTKKPLVPQVLPMEEREKLWRQRAQERTSRERPQSSSAYQSKQGNGIGRKKKRTRLAHTHVVPRTTTNFQMKTAHMQARREEESNAVKQEQDKETARHAQEQVTGKRLAQVMARMDRKQARLAKRDTVEEANKKARESRERYRKALLENKRKLEQAMKEAPTLWERHDAEMRREMAKRFALRRVAERVLGTGDWRGNTAAEKLFDEEERAILSLF